MHSKYNYYIKLNINTIFKQICKETKMWNTDYKNQGYKFMSREQILKEVCKVLSK